jgi:hypothetical protein
VILPSEPKSCGTSSFFIGYLMTVYKQPCHVKKEVLSHPLSAAGDCCTTKVSRCRLTKKFFEILIKTLIFSILAYARKEIISGKTVYSISALGLRSGG